MKKKRAVALGLTIAITVSSMTFLGSMNIDTELSAAEEITRKIFQANVEDGEWEQQMFQADYLQGLDEENDYIIVNSSVGGYAIFEREGMELIEYSDTNASPYGQESVEIYYAGPTNYYQKEKDKVKHIYTGEKFEKEQMHDVAKAVKEKIKENRKQRKEKEKSEEKTVIENDVSLYANSSVDEILSTPGNSTLGSSSLPAPMIDEILDVNRYSVLSRTYIRDKKYFLDIPTYPDNIGDGTCVTVATHILLSYNNWSKDGRIIPANTATEKFLDYDESLMTEEEIIALRSNPYDPRLMMATYGHNENDATTTFYEKLLEYIDPDKSGATVEDMINGTNRYLNNYAQTIKDQITINYSTNPATARTMIINEIDADRPVIGLIEVCEEENGVYSVFGHAVVAFGYQTILCDRTQLQGIIANFGWGPEKDSVWLNMDWVLGYISFQTNHTHSDYIQNANDSHVVACSVCKRSGYNEKHTYNIIEQIYGGPYNGDLYHMVKCTCGAESLSFHKIYYERNAYDKHMRRCSEEKCNYRGYESHFFKNGSCFQCGLEDFFGGGG